MSVFFILMACSTSENETEEIYGVDAKISMEPGSAELFVSGLQGSSGSTIGPGGDLFVAEGATGEIARIDLKTGEVSTYATGLPPSIIGIGGVTDVAFIGETAYAIVTLVGPQFGTDDEVGVYRIDGPNDYTVIANLGEFTLANPSDTEFFVEMGVYYSIEVFRDGFIIADAHHNRVLSVTKEGDISILKEFGNIVPTGLDVSGNIIYMAQAGPIPHNPEDGKVVAFGPNDSEVNTIGSGARLLVDVEFGRGQSLYALSQGIWDEVMEGSPALPNTGSLLKVEDDGTFRVIVEELDRPTSMEFVKNTAYIITLAGEIWTIENAGNPPFGS
ncbi:ScyD/ScyE family protein [Salegentibacter sp. JZCK2]|uniref:ScyD/ScyE family protein n=1 Tax=Salegentibacter tibetensis TaxID=2873600 RepID=UPI001CCBFF82|nr:ScyD/ScyE family protein [Salegentibacter tibetensis]MBZ9729560.1 ScyD/ScyE family protein [Salegentibacter tibetensis]